MRGPYRIRFIDNDPKLIFFGDKRRYIFAGQRPIHCGAEIEDIRPVTEVFPADLFRRDIVGCALDTFLDLTQFAALAQVDHLDAAARIKEDIIWLDVAMDISFLVHGIEGNRHHPENQQNIAHTQPLMIFQAGPVEKFHDHE